MIKIKPSHKGLLHKNLGVAKDKPIPASKLAKAKNSSSPAVPKRAVFAANAKKWNHSGKKYAPGKTDKSKGMSAAWHKKFAKTMGT